MPFKRPTYTNTPLPSSSSHPPLRRNQVIKQRPRQHKPHESRGHLRSPQIGDGVIKVAFRLRAGAAGVHQRRHQQAAGQVEGEAGQRLEVQRAGGDAEEGGC